MSHQCAQGGRLVCSQCSLDFARTGQQYWTKNQNIFCTRCYNSVFARACHRCQTAIIGTDFEFRIFQGKSYHNRCFHCNTCRNSLINQPIYEKNGNIYCCSCHENNFSPRCDGCGGILKPGISYFPSNGKNFHQQCFNPNQNAVAISGGCQRNPNSAASQQGTWIQLDNGSQIYAALDYLLTQTHECRNACKGSDAVGLQYNHLQLRRVLHMPNQLLSQRYLQRMSEITCKKSIIPVKDLLPNDELKTTIIAKQTMLRNECDDSLNECYLFHGTSLNAATQIFHGGFKRSETGLFGSAIYLAERSDKATQYSDKSDDENNRVPNGTPLYMIVAKACLGIPLICREPKQFTQPPCSMPHGRSSNCSKYPRLDSVIGTHNSTGNKLRSKEIALYDTRACFPEYLLEYVRI